MENIVKCANCERDINLHTDAQIFCHKCKKDFCFAMTSTCFSDYHKKNHLFEDHSVTYITDPEWKVNVRFNDE